MRGDRQEEHDAWKDKAACRGKPDPFFIERGGSSNPARTICAVECPVVPYCLREGLAQRKVDDYGIWGGTTHDDRDAIRRGKVTIEEHYLRLEGIRLRAERRAEIARKREAAAAECGVQARIEVVDWEAVRVSVALEYGDSEAAAAVLAEVLEAEASWVQRRIDEIDPEEYPVNVKATLAEVV